MKKLSLFSVCFATSICMFSQELPPEAPQITLSKDQLLQKSKNQKTAAIVLLCAGGVAATVGLAMATDDLNDELGGLFDPSYEEDNDETVSAVLFYTGAAAMLGSIPLFISSRKNKSRAMELSFKNIPSTQVYKNMLVNQRIPSINLKIRL
jgi:hypothetical protein